MTKPITPDEVAATKKTVFPDAVFDAFNTEIQAKYSNGRAKIMQEAVINRIVEETDYTRNEIFAQGWLNVEEVYRAVGWTVEYDKPAYNESYEAFFLFKK